MDLSDEALFENFRQTRDPTYFKSLVRRYQSRVHNTVYRMLGSAEEAEEVVQETCLKMLQNTDRFKQQCSFASCIFRIAHNACIDVLRARRRRSILQVCSFDPQSAPEGEDAGDVLQVVSQAADPGLNPEEALDLTEQGELIVASLKQLPDDQRAVLVLHDVEGFSYQEIADIIGVSMGTIRSRIYYGRQKLKELLDPYFSTRGMTQASR